MGKTARWNDGPRVGVGVIITRNVEVPLVRRHGVHAPLFLPFANLLSGRCYGAVPPP
jgi:hypothetical protein